MMRFYITFAIIGLLGIMAWHVTEYTSGDANAASRWSAAP